MKKNISYIVIITLLFSCTTKNKKIEKHIYPTVSYLAIKLNESGNLPSNPYIVEFKNKRKQIVFCGVNHLTNSNDIENIMFKKIEESFFKTVPQISVNEGGDVSKKKYTNKKEALLKDGEIGLLKIISDSLTIPITDGDISLKEELNELLKSYTKEEVLAYITTERLMWGLKDEGITDSLIISKKCEVFIKSYLIQKGGFALESNQCNFYFYTTSYNQLLHRNFNIYELEPTNPFKRNSKFQDIGRKSKEIRDQFLLRKIDTLLNTHDKIFVVFGGWHLLTCMPGLKEIISKH
jgi:hypothetical protein